MSLSRNATYNIIGSAIPVALAFITVPLYLRAIGTERYGVLSIAWLLLGYFGLFDLGLGRATSFRIAALRDASQEARARTFWTAMAVNLAMGLVGAAVLWAGGGYFFAHVFKVEPKLRPEIMAALPLLAAAVPVATLTGVLGGALQGRERFFESNLISLTSTVLFQFFPLAIAWTLGPNLVILLASAIAARLLGMLALWVRCHLDIGRRHAPIIDRREVPLLLRYGGWVTLASIFGPVLVIVDRFAIGGVLGAAAVGIYSVPFQLAKQIAVLPTAITNAMFPRLSGAPSSDQDSLGEKAVRSIAGLIGLPVLGGILLLEPFLQIWVGKAVTVQGAPVGRILLIGFWANAFALVPFTRLQATGRPDLVTKVLLLEIPPYLLALYLGMHWLGLTGAALALAGRFILDYLLLSWSADRSFCAFRLLLANFALLVCGAWVAGAWAVTDGRWWLGAIALSGAMLLFCWQGLPLEMRERILAVARRRPKPA